MMESVLLLLGVIFLVLIFVGIPVGYAMILTAAAHFYVLSPGLSPTVIAQRPVGLISESFTLLAVPAVPPGGKPPERLRHDRPAGGLLGRAGRPRARRARPRRGRGQRHHGRHVGLRDGGRGRHRLDHDPLAHPGGIQPAGGRGPDRVRRDAGARSSRRASPWSSTRASRTFRSAGSSSPGFLPGLVMALFLMVDLWLSKESARVARTRFEWAAPPGDRPRRDARPDHARHHPRRHVRRRVHADRGRGGGRRLRPRDRHGRLPVAHPGGDLPVAPGVGAHHRGRALRGGDGERGLVDPAPPSRRAMRSGRSSSRSRRRPRSRCSSSRP